jgi:hypothetical protein
MRPEGGELVAGVMAEKKGKRRKGGEELVDFFFSFRCFDYFSC